ncbi:LCP family protein [Streptomyces ovatisporus]|uniref:LCP family protein n=1 Tax=Streptomyces ovatisporus TaxID=1128682 RepID=A0ABV9A933_9ACTN
MTDPGTDEDRATANRTAGTAGTGHRAGHSTPDLRRPRTAPGCRPGSRPRRRWLRWAALSTSLAVLGAAGAGWTLYEKLDDNIRTDVGTAKELKRYAAERPVAPAGEAKNILLLGSDSRDGSNSAYGHDEGSPRSDTAILLHLSADRRRATGVSLPRDLMVDLPACRQADGSHIEPQFAQFNWAFQFGGAACAIRTVEKLTGVRIDHHLVVDFAGFKSLVDTVGGVDVCLPGAVRDRDSKLDLPAGRQTLGGEDALSFVRARHGLGNGSDTDRMHRQQQFLGSLVKKVRSNGVLLNPAKLYPVVHSATSALTADEGLDSLGELYELVRGARDIPEDQVRFLTVPRQSYSRDGNRDELVQPAAGQLFAQLREDRPVRVGDIDGKTQRAAPAPSVRPERPARNHAPGSAVRSSMRTEAGPQARPGDDGKGKAPPVYPGTTAAHDICTTDGAENRVN